MMTGDEDDRDSNRCAASPFRGRGTAVNRGSLGAVGSRKGPVLATLKRSKMPHVRSCTIVAQMLPNTDLLHQSRASHPNVTC